MRWPTLEQSETDAEHPALENPIEEHEVSGRLDKVVFGVTAALAIGFLAWGFIDTGSLGSASDSALGWTMHTMGWLFVLVATAFVVFVIWLAVGRFGDITLGNDGEKPEFKTVSWIAMMFSAGMGIGLMFYGVSEPLSHFVTPPPAPAPRTPARPCRRRWPPRCSTGRCTRGRSTPSSGSPSPTAPSARAVRS